MSQQTSLLSSRVLFSLLASLVLAVATGASSPSPTSPDEEDAEITLATKGGGTVVGLSADVPESSDIVLRGLVSGIEVFSVDGLGRISGDGSNLTNLSITSADVVDQSLTALDIADDAIGASEIFANAVGSSEIAANAVGSSEIAANAVGSSEIAANAVGASEIATGAVGASEIANGAVGTSEIANGSITGNDIGWPLGSTVNVSADPSFSVENGKGEIYYSTESRFGEMAGFTAFQAGHGNDAFRLEHRIGEGAGIAFNDESMTLWNPGDGDRLLGIIDEDDQLFHAWFDGDGVLFAPSDLRLKHDIQTLDSRGVLRRLKMLSGVRYKYIHTPEEIEKAGEKGEKAHLGLIAQEVEKAFPEAVSEIDGTKYIAYSHLIGPLVEAIKELEARIAELENR